MGSVISCNFKARLGVSDTPWRGDAPPPPSCMGTIPPAGGPSRGPSAAQGCPRSLLPPSPLPAPAPPAPTAPRPHVTAGGSHHATVPVPLQAHGRVLLSHGVLRHEGAGGAGGARGCTSSHPPGGGGRGARAAGPPCQDPSAPRSPSLTALGRLGRAPGQEMPHVPATCTERGEGHISYTERGERRTTRSSAGSPLLTAPRRCPRSRPRRAAGSPRGGRPGRGELSTTAPDSKGAGPPGAAASPSPPQQGQPGGTMPALPRHRARVSPGCGGSPASQGAPQPSCLLRAAQPGTGGTPDCGGTRGWGPAVSPPRAPRSVGLPAQAARGCGCVALGGPQRLLPCCPRPPLPRVPRSRRGRAGGRAPPHPQPRFGGGGAVLALRARRDPRDDENRESFPRGEGVPAPAARPGAWQAPGSCGLPRAGLGQPGSRGCGRGPGSSGAPAPGDAPPQGPAAGGAPPRPPRSQPRSGRALRARERGHGGRVIERLPRGARQLLGLLAAPAAWAPQGHGDGDGPGGSEPRS